MHAFFGKIVDEIPEEEEKVDPAEIIKDIKDHQRQLQKLIRGSVKGAWKNQLNERAEKQDIGTFNYIKYHIEY